MNNPRRNVLFPDKVADYFTHGRAKSDFNYGVHEQIHPPKTWTYTGKATIDTDAGSRIYPYRGGQLIRCRANVQVAPGSTLTWKILKNGVSVHAVAPTIASGALYAAVTEFIDNGYFVPDDYFQVQVTATGGATGPIVVLAEYLPADLF